MDKFKLSRLTTAIERDANAAALWETSSGRRHIIRRALLEGHVEGLKHGGALALEALKKVKP